MAKNIQTKREREKAMVSEMIALYCKKRHGRKNGLCPECEALDAVPSSRSGGAPCNRNPKRKLEETK